MPAQAMTAFRRRTQAMRSKNGERPTFQKEDFLRPMGAILLLIVAAVLMLHSTT